MKIVVSFSGGRTSAYTVIKAIEEFGAENVDVVYMDTGAEHPKTYEFIRKFHQYILETYGIEIVYLRTDFDTPLKQGNKYHILTVDDIGPDLKPFSEMIAKYGVPYIGGMFCTDRMKLVPFKLYCNEKYGTLGYKTYLGIRADEPARIWGDHKKKKYSVIKQLRIKGYDDQECCDKWNAMFSTPLRIDEISQLVDGDTWLAKLMIKRFYENSIMQELHYLCEISDFDKRDVLLFWSKMPFDLELEEWNGNCVFCGKKSDLKLAAAHRDNPVFYDDYLTMLHSDSVRADDNTGHWSKMYRGEQSLELLIAKFDGSTGEEIKSRIRGAKMTETGSCSESCEVFVCETNQIDMFKDAS